MCIGIPEQLTKSVVHRTVCSVVVRTIRHKMNLGRIYLKLVCNQLSLRFFVIRSAVRCMARVSLPFWQSVWQVRKVKALRTTPKRKREEEWEAEANGGESDGGAIDGSSHGDGGSVPGGEGDGVGGPTATSKAKRGTRRKSKERKVL